MNHSLSKYLRLLPLLFQFLLHKIDKTVHFTGKKYISIGKNTLISQNTWLNVNERSSNKHIIIGNNCFIGRNNFFTSGKLINLDDFVITSVNCCFLGASHDLSNPLVPYYFSSTATEDSIYIGLNVFIAANVTILGNSAINYGSIVGANTVIKSQIIPPFSLVVGNPAIVVKRYSFHDNQWKKIDLWNSEDELAVPAEDDYRKHFNNLNIKKYRLPLKAIGKSNGNLYF